MIDKVVKILVVKDPTPNLIDQLHHLKPKKGKILHMRQRMIDCTICYFLTVYVLEIKYIIYIIAIQFLYLKINVCVCVVWGGGGGINYGTTIFNIAIFFPNQGGPCPVILLPSVTDNRYKHIIFHIRKLYHIIFNLQICIFNTIN